MTATPVPARPRWLTVATVGLLLLQVALLATSAMQAIQVPGRPAYVQVVNGTTPVLLLTAMLLAPRYPRVTWALLALVLGCIVAAAFVLPRMP